MGLLIFVGIVLIVLSAYYLGSGNGYEKGFIDGSEGMRKAKNKVFEESQFRYGQVMDAMQDSYTKNITELKKLHARQISRLESKILRRDKKIRELSKLIVGKKNGA